MNALSIFIQKLYEDCLMNGEKLKKKFGMTLPYILARFGF